MCALSVHVIRFRGGGMRRKRAGTLKLRADRSLLQPEKGRSGNTISQGDGPKVMVTTRSREKSAIFCCVQLSILLMSGSYTQNGKNGKWGKSQNDSSRVGNLWEVNKM